MSAIDKIWFTRCPVPTATGLAYKLGWLEDEFKPEGIALGTLQEVGGDLARHHYDHQLANTLIREGGNLFADSTLARAQKGRRTRLIGLRPGSRNGSRSWYGPTWTSARRRTLKGKRLALRWRYSGPRTSRRTSGGRSVSRAA